MRIPRIMKIENRRPSSGFTLVEMLVVIAIIGILAGLITVAASSAINSAKDTRIKTEIDQLDMALKAFKQQYGAYPPCDLRIGANNAYPNQNTLIAFLMQAFPRYTNNGNATNIASDLSSAGVDVKNFRPDAALVFWLQGFNPDITQPFTGVPTSNTTSFSTTTYAVTPFFNFDQTRVKQVTPSGGTAHYVYTPSNQTSPYVYFDLSVYGALATAVADVAAGGAYSSASGAANPSQFVVTNTDGTAGGTATPYVLDVNANGAFAAPPDTFCNPTTFQIISAGQDNNFGAFGRVFRLFPTGTGYDSSGAENDNISNFLTGTSNLGNAMSN